MKPLLVGEANPYGGDPYYALYPAPEGCAGWRLCTKVMGLSITEYLSRFERVNLCHRDWKMKEARQRANQLRDEQIGTGRTIVMCGAKVTRAFMYPYVPFDWHGNYVCLPHPSGLSRAWNEPGAHERARDVLREAGVL
jgi:hypothetical protein